MGLGSPLVAEYLNKKYGTKFPISPGGCNALTTKAFVQLDGAMFPCQELTEYFTTRGGKKINIPRQSVLDSGAKEIWEGKLYKGLLSSFFKDNALKDYTPCNRCKYLYSICYPCPIPTLRGDKLTMRNCIMIMRKIQQEGMTTTSTVPISYQEIINRAAGDPMFRAQIITSPQEVISEYSYSLGEEHKSSLNSYISSLQDKIANRLDNMIKPKQSKIGI